MTDVQLLVEPCVRLEPPVEVRSFGAQDRVAWDDFVAQCPTATFFHKSGWRDVIEGVFAHRCHYLIAWRGRVVSGVFPLAEVRSRLFGHSLRSLPFAVYGGPIASDVGSERALTDAAVELSQRLGVDYLESRNRFAVRADWPTQDLYVTFRREILPDVEANMLAIPRKQRAMVRKGMKNGLGTRLDTRIDDFFELYADNMHRHGTPPLPRRYFLALRDVFGEACEIQTIVDAKSRPVSSVMSFYFRDEIMPYYAGDRESARELAANDFKYWELLRRACEKGVRTFDYGRSKRGTGSFDFKKNWGFEATPLAYEYKLFTVSVLPENNPLNPRYAAFIAIWKRLPRPLVNVLGPLIVRSLG